MPFLQKWIPLDNPPAFIPTGINTQAIGLGCEACHFIGFQGHKAILEVINIDDTTRLFFKIKKPLSANL